MADTPEIQLRIVTAPKFALGQLVATPNALEHLTHEDIACALNRHVTGDWGTLDKEDWAANERALEQGTRLLSVYFSKENNTKFYIITEWDRSVTTILLPEDY
jgi:hypothetical protein